ncbi:IclR family transcriptional regulator [Pigmentiphaga soli]|uniref:IclR family transcriptional regulator n=1 Tax=Pigmentiphaga soli TaxID=1007095 RepID=A0ABP8GQE6_9BURK
MIDPHLALPDLPFDDPPADPARAAASVRPADGAATSLGRAFDILGLFSLASPLVRVEDVIARLGYTRSTAYRYVRELCDAGLLTQRSGGSYSLGPRVVELERLLELTDPLYRAARAVLPSVRRDDRQLLVQELYRDDQVMCIYKEGPDELEHAGQRLTIKRARGLPFPLFRGAGSLVLLAWLSPPRMRQAYLSGIAHIAQAGLGHDWQQFRRALAAVRRRGYAVSRGQLAPVVVGIAVPILLPEDRRVIGSLALVTPSASMPLEQELEHVAQLREASERIAREYANAVRQ